MIVRGRHDQLVLVERNVALLHRPRVARQLPRILPEQVARQRVQRLHFVAVAFDEEHAIMFERRPLVLSVWQRPRPLHPQIVHVFLGDFLQRAEPMIVVRAPPKQPVPGRRILQQFVCHGREFLERIRQYHGRHRRSQRRKRHHDRRPPRRTSGNLHQRERLRIRGQCALPRLYSVHLEHVGYDLRGSIRAQLARARGRHLRVDVGEKLHRPAPAPELLLNVIPLSALANSLPPSVCPWQLAQLFA